jgi:hypothetical protein
LDKNQILKEFSADPDRYYKVKLFERTRIYQKKVAQSVADSFGL